MKIFVSIASYQDPLLESTIFSAYRNAEKPESLVFGICDQSSKPLNVDSYNFSKLQIEIVHSMGYLKHNKAYEFFCM